MSAVRPGIAWRVARASGDPEEMRAVYGASLVELARTDERIVLVDADLMRANGTGGFYEAFPDRAFDVGVAEANMVGVAAGLSTVGLIPFAETFACFAARRTFDQFFISANYARQNVKLTGSDPGVAAAFNGGTHMSFEDIGMMRTIPELVICEPSDPASLRALLPQIAFRTGSSYLRLHRKAVPPIYAPETPIELGRGIVVSEGADATVIAAGAVCVAEALDAAAFLAADGIAVTVIDMHTIKPIDADLVERAARETGAIVTVENHQVRGGLGGAVAEVLTDRFPVPQRRIGIRDEFGEVGTQEYLQERFGLTGAAIATEVREFLGSPPVAEHRTHRR